jgi:iron complex transport system permease protein
VLVALLLGKALNAVALGDDLAASLGANVLRTRGLAVLAVTLLAGGATAIAGPVSFVGLMVPHVARRLSGPDQRWIMAFSVVLGPTLLLLADIVGRLLLPVGEIPAGIVTAFLGAPVLVWLARRYRVAAL